MKHSLKITMFALFALLMAGCGSGGDSGETSAESAANQKAGKVPDGLTPEAPGAAGGAPAARSGGSTDFK